MNTLKRPSTGAPRQQVLRQRIKAQIQCPHINNGEHMKLYLQQFNPFFMIPPAIEHPDKLLACYVGKPSVAKIIVAFCTIKNKPLSVSPSIIRSFSECEKLLKLQ